VTHFEGRTFTESILSRAEGFKTTIYAGVNLSPVVKSIIPPISFFPRVAGEDEEGGARLNVPMLAAQTESLPPGPMWLGKVDARKEPSGYPTKRLRKIGIKT
jgi:hypothetical protein